MRQRFVVANWKMHTDEASARELATDLGRGLCTATGVRVAVCPPFPYLRLVGEVLGGSSVLLGAQNCYPEMEGAFTGEVSPAMLADVGCQLVIIGHSERRHKLGESDGFINRKIHAAWAAGMDVILCLGETLEERRGNRTEAVLTTQLDAGLAGAEVAHLRHLVLAYEPVWAIGTGVPEPPEEAQQAHAFLRSRIAKRFGLEAARNLLVLYGGSVHPDNTVPLFLQPDVDGGLIGGASLVADSFLAIVRAAVPV